MKIMLKKGDCQLGGVECELEPRAKVGEGLGCGDQHHSIPRDVRGWD